MTPWSWPWRWRDNRAATMLAVALALSGLLMIGTIVWAVGTLGARTVDNCQRIHRVVETLDVILASGEAQTKNYVKEGLLTPEQGKRADDYREEQRRVLSTADCKP